MSDSQLISAMDNLVKSGTKIEQIERSIRVQIEAFDAIPKDVEGNSGYKYYCSERQRITKAIEATNASYDSKLLTLEAKKRATIDDIEAKKQAIIEELERKKETIVADYEIKISALEAKKGQEVEKLEAQDEQYSKSIEEARDKIENAKPTSLAYRKLVADLEEAKKHDVQMRSDHEKVLAAYDIALAKKKRAHLKELEDEKRRLEMEQKQARIEAEAEYERKCEREQKEYLERYRARKEKEKEEGAPP